MDFSNWCNQHLNLYHLMWYVCRTKNKNDIYEKSRKLQSFSWLCSWLKVAWGKKWETSVTNYQQHFRPFFFLSFIKQRQRWKTEKKEVFKKDCRHKNYDCSTIALLDRQALKTAKTLSCVFCFVTDEEEKILFVFVTDLLLTFDDSYVDYFFRFVLFRLQFSCHV